MEFTGERMMPDSADCAPSTFWEHIYRYRFAARVVEGLDVLDIACGEGYGSAALLASGARSLIGVDLSEEAVLHARNKYNVDARVGDALAIPLADKSVDIVVSFETIEHVPQPRAFIEECYRVLRPSGLLIVSTPNTMVYGKIDQHSPNPFHCSEMDRREFEAVLDHRFQVIEMWAQKIRETRSWGVLALNSEKSPWSEVWGFQKLRGFLRWMACPQIRGSVPQQMRLDPVATVLRKDRVGAATVNPYALLRLRGDGLQGAEYLVAVARPKATVD
jgi:2-polyprenyl-3-methyl-5-hydroxy-6-metoxy-1,4-benzoquinol methylase